MQLNVSDVYESAHRAASAAITAAPEGTYGLQDVATPEEWSMIVSARLGAGAIAATLSGTVEGLRTHGATAADVLSYPDVAGFGAVTVQDVTLARGWLANVIGQDLDEDAAHRYVVAGLAAYEWLSDAERITSLVLAVVRIGGHAAAYRG